MYIINFACTIVTPKEKYDSHMKFRLIQTSPEAYHNVYHGSMNFKSLS
jgi:hypothetical protein